MDRGEGVKGDICSSYKMPIPLPLFQSGPPTPVQSVNGNTARHYVKL